MHRNLAGVFALLLLLPGCQGGSDSSRIERAQAFRELVKQGDFEAARAYMSDDPRRWWETRSGEGSQWTIDGIGGPWKKWDDHMRSQTEVVEWKEEENAAVLVQRETNDYFQLLERGWVTNEVVYYFDDNGKINGLLIRAVGERPPGATAEFIVWAQANDPDELAQLMPDGEVDPTGDHPERFRALLNRWRVATGRAPIE